MKLLIGLLLILSVFAAGFFTGRATVETKEIVKYVKGETVTGSVDRNLLQAKVEFVTDITLLPKPFWIYDTITENSIKYVEAKIDTAKLIQDFITVRKYDFPAFDDKINGRMDVRPVVQYNRLIAFDYSFTPIHKEVTKYKDPLFRPFLSASYNTYNIFGIGGGVFIKGIGVEYNYLYNSGLKSNGHMIGIKLGL